MSLIFGDPAGDAARPAEKLSGSEWAERYRRLPTKGQAEPGAYSLKRTPYLREILDVLSDDFTEVVTLMKVPQFGGSQAARSAIGAWVDQRGDPILIVYPDEASAHEEITKRVAPMFNESAQLRRHLTGRAYDVSEGVVELQGCTINVAWAGSPQTLASRAIGCALLEETDKYRRSLREASPDDLAWHRLKTFKGRRKMFALSTPTTTTGTIFRMFQDTRHKRAYWCPCPGCGALGLWSEEHVRWERQDETRDPRNVDVIGDVIEALENGQLRAWIACPAGCPFEIHETDRARAVEGGEWVTVGQQQGVRPRTKRVAYHAESLISPWVSVADYAVSWLKGHRSGDMQDHRNGFRGLPAEEIVGGQKANVLEERAREHRAHVVPPWATMLTAGADTQATAGRPWWAYVIRAWGPGLRSRLIASGRADSPQELVALTIDRSFPIEGGERHPLRPALLCVDSGGAVEVETDSTIDGSTTDLVYAMSKHDPARIVAVKGHGGATRPDRMVSPRNVDYQPRGMPPTTVLLHILDTERLKDIVARLIRAKDPVLWEESSAADANYVSEMTAEERVLLRLGRKKRWSWVNTTRRRNDLWDATVYAFAAAKILRVEERHRALEQNTDARDERVSASPSVRPNSPATSRGDEQPKRFGARVRETGRKWISRKGSR